MTTTAMTIIAVMLSPLQELPRNTFSQHPYQEESIGFGRAGCKWYCLSDLEATARRKHGVEGLAMKRAQHHAERFWETAATADPPPRQPSSTGCEQKATNKTVTKSTKIETDTKQEVQEEVQEEEVQKSNVHHAALEAPSSSSSSSSSSSRDSKKKCRPRRPSRRPLVPILWKKRGRS